MGDFKHRIYGLLTATVLALGAGPVAHAQANYPVKPIGRGWGHRGASDCCGCL